MREGLTVAIAVMASVTACAPTPGKARPEDRFVTVNGVRLHYLDWGGSGEPLLFLTPLGGDLHEQFGTLAPQFTDRLHVLGLTRRGQGQSDKPAAGYDVDTLAADVVGFLDAMGIATAHIAGHSIAGSEMTRLAGLHPSRVSTLVYLDAAVDYQNLAEISSEAGLAAPPDTALAAILVDAGSRQPDYASVQAPALNIVVVFDGPIPGRPGDDAAYTRYLTLAGERDVVGHNIRLFEEAMTRGRTLRLRNTTHGGFLGDPAQQRVFVPVMREFLLTNVTPQARRRRIVTRAIWRHQRPPPTPSAAPAATTAPTPAAGSSRSRAARPRGSSATPRIRSRAARSAPR